MANKILIFSDEFFNRVCVGLGELQSKFAHPVIVDIEEQIKLIDSDVVAHVALIEKHMADANAKVKAIKYAAEQAAKDAANVATAA